MHLSWLELRDFRSYEAVAFNPDPGVNVLVGDNGAGKTSIIEAIGYLGMMRSFRGVPDSALIRTDAQSAVLRGGFGGGPTETTVECELPVEGRRSVLVNTKRPTRMRDVLLAVPIVSFMPDDLDIVKRGPAIRRDYLDDLATMLWPQAAADLAEFERTLKQRNALLRQDGRHTDPVTLGVWDERLSESAANVLLHRRGVATALQPLLLEAYEQIGGAGELRWAYRSTWGSDDVWDKADLSMAMASALASQRPRDLDVRSTTVGPHRDEPDLLLDGRSTRRQASQGEQRTVALALRVSSHTLITDVRDVVPLLLLDDVFSELDVARASRVLSLMPTGQVFVTTAREDEVPIEGRRWSVSNGEVS